MPEAPSTWRDRKGLNDWWQRSVEKERQRLTNAPKPHKGDRLSVPTDFSHFAPPVPKKTPPPWKPPSQYAWTWKKGRP